MHELDVLLPLLAGGLDRPMLDDRRLPYHTDITHMPIYACTKAGRDTHRVVAQHAHTRGAGASLAQNPFASASVLRWIFLARLGPWPFAWDAA